MSPRVPVRPALLLWACARDRKDVGALEERFPRIAAWLEGTVQPTLKQLEAFARATHVPIGYLFLPEPPDEHLPLPDFRTLADRGEPRLSPSLLETVHLCQDRQDWYRDFARAAGATPLGMVGSARIDDEVEATAKRIRDALHFDLEARRQAPTWTDALRSFIDQAEEAGILVMCSGVVQNDTSRPLDPEEFRGFAMADELAPVIFLNGADTKAAQMFTLAHEIAHVWLGQSAVSDAQASQLPGHQVERWCNQVAAELLVPLEVLRAEYRREDDLQTEVRRLARRFKVSTLVILRRIHDAGGLSWERLWEEYAKEVARLRAIPRGSGGNFYLTQAARVSKRFARALVVSTLEGQTLYRDALRMLGFRSQETFQKLGRSLEVV